MTNVPRKIFIMAMFLIIISVILSANEAVQLGLPFAIAGIFFGFTALGLKVADDG